MGIPIFNRIEEVDFLIGDVGEVPLDKKDLHKLPHLEKFSVMQKGRKKLTESDSQSIESKVRKCRVGAIEKTDKQVSIQLNGKSPFMCAE